MDLAGLLKRLPISMPVLPKMPHFARPSKRRLAGCGLVIRPHAVELVSMAEGKLAAHARVPIEGDGPEALTRAMTQALAQAQLKPKRRLSVCLSHADVLLRYFAMPALPRAEWDQAVQFEVRKYIPFKTDTLSWDYHVLAASASAKRDAGSGKDRSRMEIVFGGVPRDVLQRFTEALGAAGLQPTAIEPLSVSLARLRLPEDDGTPDGFVCLVDVEPERAHLVIARGGVPYLMRSVPLALEPPASGAEAGSAGSAAQQLLSELRVSMDFFTREYPSAQIARVVLFGDEPRIAPWVQEMAGQLLCPVELGRSLLAGRVQAECPLAFAAAVGLLEKGGAALDFLRRSIAEKPKAAGVSSVPARSLGSLRPLVVHALTLLKEPKTLAATGVSMAAALIACWLLGARQISDARRELQAVGRSRVSVGLGLDGMSQAALAPSSAALQKQLAFLKQAVGQRSGVAARFDALVRVLPEGVWLTNLSFEDRVDEATGKSQFRLSVGGACFRQGEGLEELTAIQEFEQRVKQNPALFSGSGFVQLEGINAQTQAKYTYRTFQLSCQSGRRL